MSLFLTTAFLGMTKHGWNTLDNLFIKVVFSYLLQRADDYRIVSCFCCGTFGKQDKWGM
jgi:hypothetical protein